MLTLGHTQRLNLHVLVGAQRADVGSIRAIAPNLLRQGGLFV
jgi:hypothetical protein